MNRRSITLIAASHLVVILAGVLLARQAGGLGTSRSPSQDSKTVAANSGMTERETQRTARTFRPSKEWHGSEYARAWKALPLAKLTTGDRVKAQRDLLKRWAEKDLSSAIEAALGEAWDNDEDYVTGNGPLLDVFSEAFAMDPQQAWDLIASKQFGVASGMLRHIWMNAVGRKDPLFLAARIGDLSWRDRQDGLNACDMGLENKPTGAMRDAIFKILARLPEDVVTTEQLLSFAPTEGTGSDPAAMMEELLGLGTGDERLAKVKAMLLGAALASKSPEEIAAEIQGLPKAIGEEALWAAFKGERNAEGVLGTMDLLIGRDAWAKLEQPDTVQQLRRISRNGGAEAVADWAVSLPVRKETTELFHRSVETYLRDNMEDARDWMTAIPPGVWRDRAFAEYSQQALNGHNDPAASRWALDQIGDPAFRKTAGSWRSSWEKRTGWTGN